MTQNARKWCHGRDKKNLWLFWDGRDRKLTEEIKLWGFAVMNFGEHARVYNNYIGRGRGRRGGKTGKIPFSTFRPLMQKTTRKWGILVREGPKKGQIRGAAPLNIMFRWFQKSEMTPFPTLEMKNVLLFKGEEGQNGRRRTRSRTLPPSGQAPAITKKGIKKG